MLRQGQFAISIKFWEILLRIEADARRIIRFWWDEYLFGSLRFVPYLDLISFPFLSLLLIHVKIRWLKEPSEKALFESN